MTRFGVQLPTFDPLGIGGPPRFLDAARLAEETGFDAAWVGDHLRSPAPVHEASVALAAVAAVTERIEVGFGVMLLGLRPPPWAAKQLATIDALAPGRLLLGVGVGGEFPEEFEALGLSVRRRGRLLDAALEALPALLQGQPPLKLAPPISRLPPVYVGGRGEPSMRRAARFGDWWLPMWLTPEKIRERALRLGELAEAQERPRPRIALVLGAHVDADEDRARERAREYTEAMYGMPFERVAHWSALGSAERVAEMVRAHLDAGVEEIVFTPLTSDPLQQLPLLAEVRGIVSRR